MTDSDAEEARELRRSLRDVIALTTLPAIWSGYDATQIAADVVDLVARMLDVDGVYLSGESGGLRLRRPGAETTERCLRQAARHEETPDGELRVLSCPLSVGWDDRLIVAARREDFPNDHDRLIARVAANQAAVWLRWKRTEAALAAESAFRRAIESSMLAGVAAVDAEGTQTYVNRAFAAMVGWPEEELIGARPPFVYWAPEDLPNTEAALREVIAGRANRAGYELRFRRPDETRVDVQVLISQLEQPGGSRGFVASVYDITERKAVERNARFLAEAGEILSRSLDYEETLRAVTALAVPRLADWCFVDLMEADGGFRRTAAACPRPELASLARRLQRYYAPKQAAHGVSHTFARGEAAMLNEVTDDFLVSIARDDDHLEMLRAINFHAFISVPMTSRGSTFGVMTFIASERRQRFEARDVALASELARRAALAVDNARLYRNAQEANRAKDEFLANLSHELRTPMTAILGWAHLLQLGSLDPEQVAIGLATIRHSGQAQAKLIDDLLDVSRIVTGKLQISPAVIKLAEVVAAAVAAIRPAAEAKRQSIQLENAADVAVLADAQRLQQVFWNLLSNAVKFTPPGGQVSVRVTAHPDDVTVTVADSGEGIPPEFLPHVFERFRQAATSVRGRTGLGLGLAIAKELVEMHGGRIAAQSEGFGRGARFLVTLPRHRETPSAPPPYAAAALQDRLRSLRVLLVEDDDTTRTLLSAILGSFGAAVTDAASVAHAREKAAVCDPQILITDIELPGSDGVALLRQLRDGGHASLPAIAVTGYADGENRARLLAAGFNGFVAKPLDPTMLAEEIVRALS